MLKTLISKIIKHRVFKFAFVGGVGALLQMISANVYASFLSQSINVYSIVLSLPDFLAIDTSVLSNFIFNNIWTFSDRKLKASQIPLKFIQFNIACLMRTYRTTATKKQWNKTNPKKISNKDLGCFSILFGATSHKLPFGDVFCKSFSDTNKMLISN